MMLEAHQIYWIDRQTDESGFIPDLYETYRKALEAAEELHIANPNWVMQINRLHKYDGGHSVTAETLIQAAEQTP